MSDSRRALVFVADPPEPAERTGPYTALLEEGQWLLASQLRERFGGVGARTEKIGGRRVENFHWGAWFTGEVRRALEDGASGPVVLGYAGPGSLALLADPGLRALTRPAPASAVANNRFSSDAFAVAGDLDTILAALDTAPSDNSAVRCLEAAGFAVSDLQTYPFSRADVDTVQDLALLRIAASLPRTRPVDPVVRAYLDAAMLPSGAPLAIPRLADLSAIFRNRDAELVVAGRVPSRTWRYLERETACRVRLFAEERGMRAAPGAPRSLLGTWLNRHGPTDLVRQLASLGDAVVFDSRVLMATVSRSSDPADWPPPEERNAADFADPEPIVTPWLRELTEAIANSRKPVLAGGHFLISDGLRLLVEAAWERAPDAR